MLAFILAICIALTVGGYVDTDKIVDTAKNTVEIVLGVQEVSAEENKLYEENCIVGSHVTSKHVITVDGDATAEELLETIQREYKEGFHSTLDSVEYVNGEIILTFSK